MNKDVVDVVVIGGGPGGYVCAIRLAQLGQRVVCVEQEKLGGVCLNWGCVPSKALISLAHAYEVSTHSAHMGLTVTDARVDVPAMQRWKDSIVSKLTGGVGALLKSNGADVLFGTARLVDAKTVSVKSDTGQGRTLSAKKGIVIATGANLIDLPAIARDGGSIIGAKEAVSLQRIPKRLCVIGGGVIGLELGTAYRKFGAEVVVIEALDDILAGTDRDIRKGLRRRLNKDGIEVLTQARAEGVDKLPDGSVKIHVVQKGEKKTLSADTVLVAVGMRPNSRQVGAVEVGVKLGAAGQILVDEHGKTNVPGVYAIGDVTGPPLLAHRASKMGEVVAEHIAGGAAAMDWRGIPSAVFTSPEIATVGLTEHQARETGRGVSIGKFPFAALGRAMAMDETDGFVKTVIDAKTREVLGIHIFGPGASDLIAEATLALEMGAVAEDLHLTVHAHPTLAEGVMESAAHALGHAIHTINRKAR